jgi:pectin methylesterase-like acyl-CoA thioesterase
VEIRLIGSPQRGHAAAPSFSKGRNILDVAYTLRLSQCMHRKPHRSACPLWFRWLLASVSLIICLAPEKTPARDYFVDPSGANGAFLTVQSAVDAVTGQTETDRANIFIAPGKYIERVDVEKPFVTFIGQGAAPADVTISFNGTLVTFPEFLWHETVFIGGGATAFMARNLTFENSTPDRNITAAAALISIADRAIFDNVRCLGYQDTLLVDGMARQYFRKSFITGDGDFIFGNATAVFDQCTIESTDWGYITAASTERVTANGFVFLDCSLVAGSDRNPAVDDGTTAPTDSVVLGRPWLFEPSEQMPSVIFIRTRMGTHIASEGWDPWNLIMNPALNRDPYTRFSEWGSMNLAGVPLADSNHDGTPDGRVPWADPMNAAQAANYTLQNIFGPVDFWNATTQPETSPNAYESQGDPWNPDVQLLSLPARPGAKPQLLNISTRLSLGNGHAVGIGGFIVTGTQSKKVIVRAIGPSLGASGLANALADPTLEIHGGAADALIATNDDWRDDPGSAAELVAAGLAPGDDSESATVVTLPSGQYTAVISGKDGATGTALVEVYDGDLTADSQLANISTLGFVGAADDVLIGGFVVGTGLAEVVVRALGPSLAQFGVANPIADPTLELHDGNGSVTTNDDWQTGANPASIPASLQPLDPRESALHLSLPPGNYTAVVRGKSGAVGMALVEAYNLQ